MEAEYVVEIPKALSWLVTASEGLSGFFEAAGEEFMAWALDIVPMALVALTILNALISFIGQERFERWAAKLTGNIFARYLALPYLATFFLGNPTSCILGSSLKEKYKPAYQELVNRTEMAPMMCLFPHVNPSELFVWLGIYTGVVNGYGVRAGSLLAVCTFLIGLCTCPLNGFIIEKITGFIGKRKNVDWEAIEQRKLGLG